MTTAKATPKKLRPPPAGIFGDARDFYPELGEGRVAHELNFTKIYVSILSHLLMRMKDNYESAEADDEHIRRLAWRSFRAARIACNILFDQRFFDRRFIDDDPTGKFNAKINQ